MLACGAHVEVLLGGVVTTHVYGRFVVVFLGGLQLEVGLGGGRDGGGGGGGGAAAEAAALQHVKQLCVFRPSDTQVQNEFRRKSGGAMSS